MKRWNLLRAGQAVLPALLLLGLASTTATAQGRDAVEEGDEVTFEFRKPLVNGLGLKSLDELRGKPVFIEFWGTR